MPAAIDPLTPRTLKTKPLKVYWWEGVDGAARYMAAKHIDEVRHKRADARQVALTTSEAGKEMALRYLGEVVHLAEDGVWTVEG